MVGSFPSLTLFFILHCSADGEEIYGSQFTVAHSSRFITFSLAASFMALRSIICVEILGLEKLTKTFGMFSMTLGIGILAGTPLLGLLKEINGTYEYTFVASGALMVVSGVLHGLLPWVKQWEERKIKSEEVQA
jgi:MFS-type transporter involved in bile tolerance (Atg22 family)